MKKIILSLLLLFGVQNIIVASEKATFVTAVTKCTKTVLTSKKMKTFVKLALNGFKKVKYKCSNFSMNTLYFSLYFFAGYFDYKLNFLCLNSKAFDLGKKAIFTKEFYRKFFDKTTKSTDAGRFFKKSSFLGLCRNFYRIFLYTTYFYSIVDQDEFRFSFRYWLGPLLLWCTGTSVAILEDNHIKRKQEYKNFLKGKLQEKAESIIRKNQRIERKNQRIEDLDQIVQNQAISIDNFQARIHELEAKLNPGAMGSGGEKLS